MLRRSSLKRFAVAVQYNRGIVLMVLFGLSHRFYEKWGLIDDQYSHIDCDHDHGGHHMARMALA